MARRTLMLARRSPTAVQAPVPVEGRDHLARAQRPAHTSRIIKAGALLADTKLLLASWDESLSIERNLRAALDRNVLGKASRSRVEDILGIFRRRYVSDPQVAAALVRLVKGNLPAEALDSILYFHAAHADTVLHDVVTDVLWSLHERGLREVRLRDIIEALSGWVARGRTGHGWSPSTIERVAQGVLATLRDFGVLEGAVHKRLAAPRKMAPAAFAYVAFVLARDTASGARLVSHPEWRLFLLGQTAVERLFMEAHQEGLLHYSAAGRVVRVDFPARTLGEYASAILERAHRAAGA